MTPCIRRFLHCGTVNMTVQLRTTRAFSARIVCLISWNSELIHSSFKPVACNFLRTLRASSSLSFSISWRGDSGNPCWQKSEQPDSSRRGRRRGITDKTDSQGASRDSLESQRKSPLETTILRVRCAVADPG